jgi:Lanthionine synthetase C-like protein
MNPLPPADYKSAANLVGEWLLGTAQRGPGGWSWPARPDVAPGVNPSLYNGVVGPALFFVEAHRTDGDERWLEPARGAASWMAHHLEESAVGWAGCGLFTGIGGWALFLDELASATDDDEVRDQAATVVKAIMDARWISIPSAGAMARPGWDGCSGSSRSAPAT